MINGLPLLIRLNLDKHSVLPFLTRISIISIYTSSPKFFLAIYGLWSYVPECAIVSAPFKSVCHSLERQALISTPDVFRRCDECLTVKVAWFSALCVLQNQILNTEVFIFCRVSNSPVTFFAYFFEKAVIKFPVSISSFRCPRLVRKP